MVHEIGETARSVVDVFKAQPFALAMVVVILGMMGLLYWQGTIAERERTRSLELLYENRKYVGDMLSRCQLIPKPN